MRLRAVKPLHYATRQLVPGDVFETVRDRDARVLLATRKVERVRDPVEVPPPPPAVAEKIEAAVAPVEPADVSDMAIGRIPSDELAAARVNYEAAFGKRPYQRWDVETLRQKIAEKAGEAKESTAN